MIDLAIDLWDDSYRPDVRCITTNGTVQDGRNVMGGGCAREAAQRYPELPAIYGALILDQGNHVHCVGPIVLFPVKHEVWEKADLDLIERSAHELVALADEHDWHRVALPRPGCGLGGRDWHTEVQPLLASLFDDRFLIIDFPGGLQA